MVNSFIDARLSAICRIDVLHLVNHWMKALPVVRFEWDPLTSRTRKDDQAPEGEGLKVCVWINPYIGQRSAGVFKS